MDKVITILVMLFTTLSYSQEGISGQTNIPFTLSPDGHIIIQAKVNGIEGNFIFDTAAGINLLTKEFADKIKGLEKTHHFTTGHRATGEEIRSDLWYSKILEIGGFEIKNEVVTVYDIEFPLDGLISLTPFIDTPITIDFDNKVLSVESHSSLKDRILNKAFEMPLQISNGSGYDLGIKTKVQLRDKLTLNVKLDSGAGSDVYKFNSIYMKNLGIDSTRLEREYRKSYFKPEEGNMHYFATVDKMGDSHKNVAVTDFKATFIDGLIYEGIMGIDWIGNVITIDIPNKRLIVQK